MGFKMGKKWFRCSYLRNRWLTYGRNEEVRTKFSVDFQMDKKIQCFLWVRLDMGSGKKGSEWLIKRFFLS